ncbi:MAG TPA: hypothetical protein VG204_08985 [Terriglobia bacterium]|nr:hypothetical protein [Terriglobia bacterium]
MIIVIAVCCFLAACAAQGPPQPPRVERPERVTDLAVTQVGRTLELSFTPPALATDGERLSKPLEIEIFRTATPPGQKPAPAVSAETPWMTLQPRDLALTAQGEKVQVPSVFSEPEFSRAVGSTFVFAVRGLTRGFKRRSIPAQSSNAAQAALLDVSAPVEGLEGQTTEHAIDLHWTPPQRDLAGGPLANLAGYRLYKSKTGKPDSFEPVAETADPGYQDHDFVFDTTYFYKVRAVFKQGGQTAESDDSKPFVVTPHDIFPPATPAGLTGIYTAGAVELIWTANTESDLAGYNVYRRDETTPQGASALPQKLNRELVGTPLYRDTSVERGHRYAYWVTAVDLSKNASSLSAGVRVEAQ